jgi:Methyltransferase domain
VPTTPSTRLPRRDRAVVTFGAVATTLTERLRAAPPGIHGGGDEYWGLAWPALEWLERELRADMATVETGSGASTIVFAAAGADHVAVTPDPDEEARVRAACRELGISSDRVSFEVGYSHDVLPRLSERTLDLALLDGAHGFPYPILDWWNIAPRLKVGGRVLLDDAYMPPVAVVLDYARSSRAWDVEPAISYRTVVLRKVAEELPPFDWEGERLGGRMTFRYLPPLDRAVAATRHRVFSTRAGLALVELYRRGSGLKWRRTG